MAQASGIAGQFLDTHTGISTAPPRPVLTRGPGAPSAPGRLVSSESARAVARSSRSRLQRPKIWWAASRRVWFLAFGAGGAACGGGVKGFPW